MLHAKMTKAKQNQVTSNETIKATQEESRSLPKQICSFPSEMIKMSLRDLSHASVNLN